MRKLGRTASGLATLVLLLPGGAAGAAEAQIVAGPPDASAMRSALYGVTVAAPDTPGELGYLEVAWAEADIARRHLDRALAAVENHAKLKQEVAQALYAVDPRYGAAGEGLGYGMRPALTKAVQGMGQVTRLNPGDGRAQEVGAAMAAANLHVDEAVDFGRAALVTPSGEVAHQAARAMLTALDRAVDGCDIGDRLDWRRGEPGLRQAEDSAASLAGELAAR